VSATAVKAIAVKDKAVIHCFTKFIVDSCTDFFRMKRKLWLAYLILSTVSFIPALVSKTVR
jgi:hypothetical protein